MGRLGLVVGEVEDAALGGFYKFPSRYEKSKWLKERVLNLAFEVRYVPVTVASRQSHAAIQGASTQDDE